MQSKIKLPTMTLTRGGVEVAIRLVSVTVNPKQVRSVNNRYFVGDARLHGTDEIPRKALSGSGYKFNGAKVPLGSERKLRFFFHSTGHFLSIHSVRNRQPSWSSLAITIRIFLS